MTPKQLEQLRAFARQVTQGQADSAMFLSLWSDSILDPGKEPVPIFQLGYAMVLDKPIIVVAPFGSHVPENIRKVAVAIEYFDRDDHASCEAATIRALSAVMDVISKQ